MYFHYRSVLFNDVMMGVGCRGVGGGVAAALACPLVHKCFLHDCLHDVWGVRGGKVCNFIHLRVTDNLPLEGVNVL